MYLYAILAYLGVLVILGLYKSRNLKTGDDFLVAGRTLPARVLVFTLLATWIGSGSLFGGAGLGYRAGFSGVVAIGRRVDGHRFGVLSGAPRATDCQLHHA